MTIQLNIAMLQWAANKMGYDLPEFAHTLYTNKSVVDDIVQGRLTIKHIRKFAEHAKVPFGFLFLSSPPAQYDPHHGLTDFRTVNHNQPLSKDFLDIYKDIEHKQTWYRDYLIGIDAPKLAFVGQYRDQKKTDAAAIAADIRTTLALADLAVNLKSAEDYYTALVQHCEAAGVLVFKNSIVVNSTKRKLDCEEFRGFVISDDYAPAIFINGEDSKYANIFTLAHELAHIWLGESGISDADIASQNQNEVRCNAIAAEILVPGNEFIAKWRSLGTKDFREKVSDLNKTFKVSKLVIARVALTNDMIHVDEYQSFHAETMKQWRDKKLKDKARDNKIPLKHTLPARNSRRLTKTIVDLLKSNRIGPGEAAHLLNTTPANLLKLSP